MKYFELPGSGVSAINLTMVCFLLFSSKFLQLKQKEILESIHYAKRIQRTRISSEKYISRVLSSLKKIQQVIHSPWTDAVFQHNNHTFVTQF